MLTVNSYVTCGCGCYCQCSCASATMKAKGKNLGKNTSLNYRVKKAQHLRASK